MRVADIMTRKVQIARPDQSICEVANLMAEMDVGSLPVGENDRLIGMITDRDIAIRAVAKEKNPNTKVSEVMSREIKYCFDDEEISHVTRNISKIKVRRLPVVNRQKRLVGIVTLADIANKENAQCIVEAVKGVSQPKHFNT